VSARKKRAVLQRNSESIEGICYFYYSKAKKKIEKKELLILLVPERKKAIEGISPLLRRKSELYSLP